MTLELRPRSIFSRFRGNCTELQPSDLPQFTDETPTTPEETNTIRVRILGSKNSMTGEVNEYEKPFHNTVREIPSATMQSGSELNILNPN